MKSSQFFSAQVRRSPKGPKQCWKLWPHHRSPNPWKMSRLFLRREKDGTGLAGEGWFPNRDEKLHLSWSRNHGGHQGSTEPGPELEIG